MRSPERTCTRLGPLPRSHCRSTGQMTRSVPSPQPTLPWAGRSVDGYGLAGPRYFMLPNVPERPAWRLVGGLLQGGACAPRRRSPAPGSALGPPGRTPGHTPHVTRLRLAHMAGRRDPGSAIFLSSRLSGSRPSRLGRRSEPSLRDGFASPDPASAHQEIGACDEDGEIRRRRGWAALV